MLKLLSGNQKGMSLVEVTVAAAISIVIAMGVMKINETSVKGMRSLEDKSDLRTSQNILSGHLMSGDKCKASSFNVYNWESATTNVDGIIPPNYPDAAATAHYRVNPLGATFTIVTRLSPTIGSKTITVGDTLPWSKNWDVDSYRFYDQDSAGTCSVMLALSKKSTGNTMGAENRNIWFNLSCVLVPATNVIDTCSNQNTVADGAFQDNTGGSGGVVSSVTPVIVGSDPGTVTSALHVDDAGKTWDSVAGTINHAISVPDNAAITFGNNDEIGIYRDGTNLLVRGTGNVGIGTLTPGSPLSVNGNTAVTGNVAATGTVSGSAVTSSGNITATGTVGAATVTSSGNITATGAVSAASVTSSGNISATGSASASSVAVTNGITASTVSTTGDITSGSTLASQVLVANVAVNSPRIWGINTVEGPNHWATNYNTYSDKRFKKRIKSIKRASEKLSEIVGVTYFMRKDKFPNMGFDDGRHVGLIAQNVEKVFPELVVTHADSGMKAVKYSNFVAILIEAFKEQKEEIVKNRKMLKIMQEGIAQKDDEQDSRIEALEKENRELRNALETLSRRLNKLESNKE
jgi:hypothetical protein